MEDIQSRLYICPTKIPKSQDIIDVDVFLPEGIFDPMDYLRGYLSGWFWEFEIHRVCHYRKAFDDTRHRIEMGWRSERKDAAWPSKYLAHYDAFSCPAGDSFIRGYFDSLRGRHAEIYFTKILSGETLSEKELLQIVG